ncbi:Jacalin-type lectin domain-containing protein [Mycena sanguinolenta]|uniref:Jacalin-type lectin domain-containing protein n=1 Tax=Mycena sanguinolenta TaxID=230812 RepID=A0A8H6U3Q6_9AGAR|nr:Jacalin-type lectin domain-containing protein [Mycena sanguinolenta]
MSNASPWIEPRLVGGNGGGRFEAHGLQPHRFALVKRLEMWWDDVRIRGMRITFSDDVVSPIYGSTDKNYKAITFDMNSTAADPGPERVTMMWMQNSGDRARLGRVHIETSRGQKWEEGPFKYKDRVQLDVGTGIFGGMDGRYGADIDAAGPLFLRSPIAKFAVGKITYTPDPNGLATGIQPVTINQAHYTNPASAPKPITWTFGGSETRTVTSSHEMSSISTFGGNVGVEVSGEVFGVGAKATAGFEWSSEQSQTTGTSTSDETQFNWALSGELGPGQAIFCKAIVQRGTLNLSYSGTVTVTLKNGTKFERRSSLIPTINRWRN